METLSYSFEKPETGDKGSVFFPALEDNIQKLNDHTHNGTNSAKITSASSTAVTATLASASWGALGGGFYSQTKSMPAGMSYDDYGLQFKDSSGHILFPVVQKVSSSSYTVFVNDNSLTLTVLYI